MTDILVFLFPRNKGLFSYKKPGTAQPTSMQSQEEEAIHVKEGGMLDTMAIGHMKGTYI